MRTFRLIQTAVVLVGLAAFPGAARPGPGGGKLAFEKLKALVGDWESSSAAEPKPMLKIELVSGGSALLERFAAINEGRKVEMVTMYYLDGEDIRMTHYCAAGNQPTMIGAFSPETGTLTFHFVGATNMKSPNDGHMHHSVYKFIDNDHFRTEWTFQKDQKDAMTEDVTYVRKY